MTGSTITPEAERELQGDLVLAALRDAAPEEVDVFSAHRDAYLDGRVPDAEPGDEELAFGEYLIPSLIPCVVLAAQVGLPLIAEAFAKSLQDELKTTFSDWLHRLLHRRERGIAPIPPDVVKRVRDAAYEVLIRAGKSEEEAKTAADAVAGRFVIGEAGAS
ncbi:hypothetical protein GCM10010492_06480 [Saccharothrix mutabilis subsp. mutabilis]|uniref:Uncharacterized protein n=1 Tax=Saccharothrix mutabilis subsp. mutabilis TaxID=66855 RepID=A0ABP3CNV9_9PSEU